MPFGLFDTAPEWLLFLAIAGLMVLGLELGYFLGGRDESDETTRGQAFTLEAAFLGLVALLLGFTFSMTVDRYQARRQLVIAEADAIDTAYLRLDVLPPEQRDEMRALMLRYLDLRLRFGTLMDRPSIEAAAREASQVGGEIWVRASAFAAQSQSATSALLLGGLNDAFDRAGDRLAEFVERVPTAVILMLVLASVVACTWVGLAHGFGRRRSRETWVALAFLLSAIIMLLVDLDRPRTGIILVSQYPMQVLEEGLKR